MDSFELINMLENFRAVEWVVFLFFRAQGQFFLVDHSEDSADMSTISILSLIKYVTLNK